MLSVASTRVPRIVKARQLVNTRGRGSISVVPLNSLTGLEREKAMTDIAKFAAISTSIFSFCEPEPQDAPIGSIVIPASTRAPSKF
jgi:hypothetical protein